MEIIIITGPMFAGKTTHLLQLFRSEPRTKILIKPMCDDRYGTESKVFSHTTESEPCLVMEHLLDFDPSSINCVFIDEGQFFEDISLFVETCRSKGVETVCISGLLFDCKQKKFGSLHTLQDAYHTITLFATCFLCGLENAEHTIPTMEYNGRRRISNSGYHPICTCCLQVHGNEISFEISRRQLNAD